VRAFTGPSRVAALAGVMSEDVPLSAAAVPSPAMVELCRNLRRVSLLLIISSSFGYSLDEGLGLLLVT